MAAIAGWLLKLYHGNSNVVSIGGQPCPDDQDCMVIPLVVVDGLVPSYHLGRKVIHAYPCKFLM